MTDNFILPNDHISIVTTYEEQAEFLLDAKEWQTVNKIAIFKLIKELIGVGASKLLPAMADWAYKRKVKEVTTEEYVRYIMTRG